LYLEPDVFIGLDGDLADKVLVIFDKGKTKFQSGFCVFGLVDKGDQLGVLMVMDELFRLAEPLVQVREINSYGSIDQAVRTHGSFFFPGLEETGLY
jgi:hypothetical protein